MITSQTVGQVEFHGESTALASNWYAVQTAPRHERKIFTHLVNEGFESFLPVRSELRQWSDRKQKVEFPLFPNYVFVCLKDFHSERLRVIRKSGVVRFVGNQSGALTIPDEEISNVRRLLKTETNCKAHPYLKAGQRVRICEGSLKGIEGILLRIANERTLVLSVDLIQRSLAIQVQGYEVEVV